MITIKNIYDEEYSKLVSYYQDKNFAFSVFNFLFQFIFKKSYILFDKNKIFNPEEINKFKKCIDKIINLDYPYQYILGKVYFCQTEIEIQPPILIPRSETEFWIYYLIKILSPTLKNSALQIADFCSGSGCMGIALLRQFAKSSCVAFDNCHESIKLASKNAITNQVRNRYTLYNKNIFHIKKNKKYDIIISNPPYISLENYNKLDNSVKNWETKQALTDNAEGYNFISYILLFTKKKLKKDSLLAIEICDSYAEYILKIAKNLYKKDLVFLLKDQFKKNRVIIVVKGNLKYHFGKIL